MGLGEEGDDSMLFKNTENRSRLFSKGDSCYELLSCANVEDNDD